MSLNKVFPPIIILILFFACWQIASFYYDMKFLLPGPINVFETFLLDYSIILQGAFITFREAITGFIIATMIGLVVATIMSLSKILEKSLYPYAILLQTVPVVAVAPLIVLWFGFEERSVIIISVIISLFPIINNTLFGLKSTPETLMELFKMHKSNNFNNFIKLKFPYALPNIIAGMKISAGLSVIGSIVGEFIIGSGSSVGGLGVQIIYAQANLETSLVMALIFTSTFLGFMFFTVISILGYILLNTWHESELKKA